MLYYYFITVAAVRFPYSDAFVCTRDARIPTAVVAAAPPPLLLLQVRPFTFRFVLPTRRSRVTSETRLFSTLRFGAYVKNKTFFNRMRIKKEKKEKTVCP